MRRGYGALLHATPGDKQDVDEEETGKMPPAENEKIDFLTYVFGKPGELDRDLARMGNPAS